MPHPDAPTGLSAVAVSETEIMLTWTQYEPTAQVDHYIRMAYDTDSGFGAPSYAQTIRDETTYTLSGLSPGTTYYIKIQSYVDDGVTLGGTFSSTVNAQTQGSSAFIPAWGRNANQTITPNQS